MGLGNSQTIEQTFDMKVLNKSIFKQITTNQQSLSASLNNVQKVEIQLGDINEGCDLTIGQTIDATSISSTVMSATTIAETKDAVQTELNSSAQAALEKTTEMGNFQFGDEQDIKLKVSQEIENVVEKTFETKNINEVVSSVVNVQEGKLKIGNCSGKLVIKQDIVAQLMAEAITESLTSAISDNEMLSKLKAAADAAAKTENKGIADIVGTFFDGMTGWIKYLTIACIIFVCVICLGGTIFLLSPAGQQSTTKLANAGANRLRGH